jgi:hypothetical protein
MTFGRPEPGEYAPYFERYISKVPDGDILTLLASQIGDTTRLLAGLSDQQARRRYAPGKWSVKEVVGHLADTERVLSYRALRFARGDTTPLPGFDENVLVANAGFDARPLADLLAEFDLVRRATLALFRSLDAEAARRRGVANENTVSVRALAYIIAGHERHHREILVERYLGGT